MISARRAGGESGLGGTAVLMPVIISSTFTWDRRGGNVPHTIVSILLALAGILQTPASDRIVIEAVIDAPVETVWKAYTTKEGLESWMVPKADIRLAVGGTFRTHFDPNGKIGDAETIESAILSFEPERMLSLRVAKAPASLPLKTAAEKTWSVVYFTPDGQKTRIREVTMGFGPDEESQQLRGFLDSGNRMLLDRLQKRFSK
jgi:uncharacterized protein YndB with AHSA1/START domain